MRELERCLLLVALTAPALGCGRPAGPEPSAAVRAELEAARDTVWRAWFDNNQDALGQLLPPEFIGIDPGEEAWSNRAKAMAGAAEFAASGGRLLRLGFPESAFQVYGDVAFVYSRYEVEMLQGNDTVRLAGRSTEVFQRQNGRWVNPGWHLDSGR
jgi:hypothetical protein